MQQNGSMMGKAATQSRAGLQKEGLPLWTKTGGSGLRAMGRRQDKDVQGSTCKGCPVNISETGSGIPLSCPALCSLLSSKLDLLGYW